MRKDLPVSDTIILMGIIGVIRLNYWSLNNQLISYLTQGLTSFIVYSEDAIDIHTAFVIIYFDVYIS